MMRYAEHFGGAWPLGPFGYAYSVKITFEQEERVLCSISHLTMKHALVISL